MSKERNLAFVKGTVSLSISVIITKMLGVAFKIPLSYVLGDEGMGYFNTAYAIYGFFYILCTAGVPKSLTLISSRCNAESGNKNDRFILKCGLSLFGKIGSIATLLNILCAPAIVRFIGNKSAVLSIIAIAPSILFVSLSGVLRGYLNSSERLTPIAISQLLEAIAKLVFGLFFALIGVRRSASISVISALAISGITVGSIMSFLYMLVVSFFKNINNNTKQNCQYTHKYVKRQILKNALPIALSSSLLNLSSTIDLTVIIKRLVSNGMSEVHANSIYGNYTTLAVPMFTLVVSVLTPLATSYMPRLSSDAMKGNNRRFREELDKLLVVTLIISVPASLAFYFYSFELLDILFSVQSSAIGADMLVCLSFGLCLLTSLTVINTALESQGKIIVTVLSLLLGAVTKFFVSYLLVGSEEFGILGAPIGTVFSYAVSFMVALFALELSGIKLRVLRKIIVFYATGIISFYPFYKLIYVAGVGKNSLVSMALSATLSCVSYIALLLSAYFVCTSKQMFKMHKKHIA